MITREDQIEQSVQNFLRAGLVEAEYTDEKVGVRDAFPTTGERSTALTKTQVCLGFNFDDGGQPVEMGSDLTKRTYTVEFWVFGVSQNYGRNVANVIRTILEKAGMVPLIDLEAVAEAEDPETVEPIDQILLAPSRAVTVNRQVNPDPRPWDKHVWTVTLKLEDTYSPSAVN